MQSLDIEQADRVAHLMVRARAHTILEHPFFGAILLGQKMEADHSPGFTASTNGKVIKYGPAFFDAMRQEAGRVFVLAHESLHTAMGHPWRVKTLESQYLDSHFGGDKRALHMFANIAADYAINPVLVNVGLVPPEGVAMCIDSKYEGMSFEEIFIERLKTNPPQESPGGGGGFGDFEPAPDDSPAPGMPGQGDADGDGPPDSSLADSLPDDLQNAVATKQAAAMAKSIGRLPAPLAELLKIDSKPEAQIDWRQKLRQVIAGAIPSDTTWRKPNRRFVWQGLYLPSVNRESAGHIVFAVDQSGSVSDDELAECSGELTNIMESMRPTSLTVVCWDSSICEESVVEYGPDDEVELKRYRHGGTKPEVVFPWVESLPQTPHLLVVFSDMEFYGDRLVEPAYPVMFLGSSRAADNAAPFGEYARLDKVPA